ncbi:CASP8-associated protein 2 [Lingula anatina]|uniref:CASP8-associated protein 2 n=1 Tax=Lingula anatina TaxID=7574 RepID=A0A1S3KHA7_LINAN|nr:CASP8-associated protein 2 [Lingula anatina]XP_013422013.1 CASP8-associated protein 2 [Lingula anatina]|eukprot:XP_013422012.1 CASP8-associated protein 2 [Lingula anatina]
MDVSEEELSNLDLYSDLLSTDHQHEEIEKQELKSRLEDVVRENEEMKKELAKFHVQTETLVKENAVLKKNMSALYQTAKLEMKRKEADITRMRKTMETYAKLIRKQGLSLPNPEVKPAVVKENFSGTFIGSRERNVNQTMPVKVSDPKPRSESENVQTRLMGIAAMSYGQGFQGSSEVEKNDRSGPEKYKNCSEDEGKVIVKSIFCDSEQVEVTNSSIHGNGQKHDKNDFIDNRTSKERKKTSLKADSKGKEKNALHSKRSSNDRLDRTPETRYSRERGHGSQENRSNKDDYRCNQKHNKDNGNKSVERKSSHDREDKKPVKRESNERDNYISEKRPNMERKDDTVKKNARTSEDKCRPEKLLSKEERNSFAVKTSASKERSKLDRSTGGKDRCHDSRSHHSHERKHLDLCDRRKEEVKSIDGDHSKGHQCEAKQHGKVLNHANKKRKLTTGHSERPSKLSRKNQRGHSESHKHSRTKSTIHSSEKDRDSLEHEHLVEHRSQAKNTGFKYLKPTKPFDIDRMELYMKHAQHHFEVRRRKKKGSVKTLDLPRTAVKKTEQTGNSSQLPCPDQIAKTHDLDDPICQRIENSVPKVTNGVSSDLTNKRAAAHVFYPTHKEEQPFDRSFNEDAVGNNFGEGSKMKEHEEMANIGGIYKGIKMEPVVTLSETDSKESKISKKEKDVSNEAYQTGVFDSDVVEEITGVSNQIESGVGSALSCARTEVPAAVMEHNGLMETSDVLEVQQLKPFELEGDIKNAGIKDMSETREIPQLVQKNKMDFPVEVMDLSERNESGLVDIVELGLGETSPLIDGEMDDLVLDFKDRNGLENESAEEGEITSESEDETKSRKCTNEPVKSSRDSRQNCPEHRKRNSNKEFFKRHHGKTDERNLSKSQIEKRKRSISHSENGFKKDASHHNSRYKIKDTKNEGQEKKKRDGSRTDKNLHKEYSESNQPRKHRKENECEAKENCPRKSYSKDDRSRSKRP